MSKTEQFEKEIIMRGMTDEDFSTYEKFLKRVRNNFLKRQHCYTTAIQFPREYAEQAVKLIKYGLENFEDGWFSTYTSYLYIGHIYEKAGKYQKAFDAYLSAKTALGSDPSEYIKELSKSLFWMKLHIDSFQYSKEMEDYFLCYEKTDDFSKSFLNSEFRLAVAGTVISLYYGKTDEAKTQIETAKKICQPNHIGKLNSILVRHQYHEALNESPESIAFIQNIKI